MFQGQSNYMIFYKMFYEETMFYLLVSDKDARGVSK